ncbi:MAG TPA: dihydroorotase [Pseudogracilibacillus sp.]|nr:dihydroorotase [Pseudogracilibacillus sp.]
MTIILKNAQLLVENNQLETYDLQIEGERITRIEKEINEAADKIIDCQGKLLTPGFIDVHIHLREPGGEHKETIKTGTMAAARGGYTTVCSMPNTNPVPDSVEEVEKLFERIEKDAVVRVLPYAAITKGLKGKERTDISALSNTDIFAFTDDGVGIQTAGQMLEAMQEAAANDRAIVAHCEDNSILYGGAVHEGDVSKRLNVPGILSACESVQIARDVLLAETANCHYHVCHVSTKESVRVIRDAKRAGIHVTAEVSPHHLLLTEDDFVELDTNFKMNPPLRAKADRDALFEGLLDGTIDFIATDHAPHAQDEKAQDMVKAPFGIVGLETAFPLLYTHLVETGEMTLQQLVDRMTNIPANVFKLPYGEIETDAIADLTLIDLEKEMTIDVETFYSKGKNTPFNGWDVKGVPVLTIAAGKIVYEDEMNE